MWPSFILSFQDPGRDGSHMPRHHQLGHSQHCCGGLVQFCHFQRRSTDLPPEGQLRSGTPALDHCSGARQGKGRPHAGRVRWEGGNVERRLDTCSGYARNKCVVSLSLWHFFAFWSCYLPFPLPQTTQVMNAPQCPQPQDRVEAVTQKSNLRYAH